MIAAAASSIAVRLAGASALIAAVVLTALGLLTAEQLHEVAIRTATALAADDLRPFAVDLRRDSEEQPDPSATGVFVLVLSPDGSVRRNSMPGDLARRAREVAATGTVEVGRGRFQVVAERVATDGGTWQLWAARDLTGSDALQQGVRTTLLVGIPVAVLLTAIAAWFVASGALRPVARMRETAERLRSGRESGALPAEGGRQLAELAGTLNGLIADLRAGVEHERRLTADAAHELRTPIAVLSAQIELAQRHPGEAALAGVRASVDRLRVLADDLLALARAESAEAPSGPTPVAGLVTEAMAAVDRFRLLAEPAVQVDLALDQPLDEAALVAIDAADFGRVLGNLVGNALAAGPASLVLIRIGTDGAALRVAVVDDGPGVPPDFLPYAFDRFSRSERSRREGPGGAGIGLALVDRLVRRAGGRATLENGPEHGAVASARLPLAPPSAGNGGAATFEESRPPRCLRAAPHRQTVPDRHPSEEGPR